MGGVYYLAGQLREIMLIETWLDLDDHGEWPVVHRFEYKLGFGPDCARVGRRKSWPEVRDGQRLSRNSASESFAEPRVQSKIGMHVSEESEEESRVMVLVD
jgi:hypothetical protein